MNEQLTLDQLCNLADEGTDDESLPYFVPHLGGRVSPSAPELRGGWVGLHWKANRGTMFRALLDGVALEYAIYKEVLHDLLPEWELKEIRVTGGGHKSEVWNQLKSDRLG